MDNQVPNDPNPQEVQPSNPTPPTPLPGNLLHRSPLMKIGIGIVGFIVIIGIIVSAMQYISSQYQTTTPLEEQKPTEQPSLAPDITAKWQTFSSDNAKLSFKYPPQFTVEDEGYRIIVATKDNPKPHMIILYIPGQAEEFNSVEEPKAIASCKRSTPKDITVSDTRIRVLEDCPNKTSYRDGLDNPVFIYSTNGMIYNMDVYGKIDKDVLYAFLGTFRFD